MKIKRDIEQLNESYKKILTEDTIDKVSNEVLKQAAPEISKSNTAIKDESEDVYDLNDTNTDVASVNQYNDTDLPTFNYSSLKLYLSLAYDTKKPLLIYGEPGLGKSAIVLNFARTTAQEKHREFVDWFRSSTQKKIETLQTPEKYFVLVDVRTAQLEPTDFVGIPDITSNKEYLETKQPKWVYLMAQPNADGILFLDELNQGNPQVLKALYEVVLDRSAGGLKFSDEFATIAAGNLGSEFGNDPIPLALTNRFTAGVLVADPESWFDYAEGAGIDKRILAFVKTNPAENFYVKPKNPDDPFPSPRQMEKLSQTMKSINAQYKQAKEQGKKLTISKFKAIGDQAAGLCGITWARKFLVFLKHMAEFDFNKVVSEVKDINQKEIGLKHALYVFVVNKLKYAAKLILANPNDINGLGIIQGVVKIINHLNPEGRIVLVSSIKKELKDEEFKVFATVSVGPQIDEKDRKEFVHNIKDESMKVLRGSK